MLCPSKKMFPCICSNFSRKIMTFISLAPYLSKYWNELILFKLSERVIMLYIQLLIYLFDGWTVMSSPQGPLLASTTSWRLPSSSMSLMVFWKQGGRKFPLQVLLKESQFSRASSASIASEKVIFQIGFSKSRLLQPTSLAENFPICAWNKMVIDDQVVRN